MTTLHEVQNALKRSVLEGEDGAAVAYVEENYLSPGQRLNIYRNTCATTLMNALRLAYPAVQRLVGGEFFDGAARSFIRERPPRSAYLNEYGAEFPDFLGRFSPAASVPYLPDVARLEWAVNCALHAPDTEPLEVACLAEIPMTSHDLVCFVPHLAVQLVRSDYPVDTIWRAVLEQDDVALSQIDLAAGPIWLIVQRGPQGVDLDRMKESEWAFAKDLFGGQPLGAALNRTAEIDAVSLLAEHLAAGRFTKFDVASSTLNPPENSP